MRQAPYRSQPYGAKPIAQDQIWRIRRRIKSARETRLERQQFRLARNAETSYARQLRQVATQVGHFVSGHFNPDNPNDPGWQAIIDSLMQHAGLIRNWAKSVANKMLADVDRRDMTAWQEHGKEIGRALRTELQRAPIANAYYDLWQQQVDAIAGISEKSAERIANLRDRSLQMVTTGERWNDIVDQVMAQEDVSKAHANTIARTETARAHSTFTAVRAQTLGATHFQWLTSNDADVRPLHRQIARTNGGVYRFDNPPILDDGRPGLPGTIWNCRCFLRPLLPDEPQQMPQPARSPEYSASLLPEAEPINKAYRDGRINYGTYQQRLRALIS
jgi:SPP1 gp7 family putative phage head morphogenesis protein